MIDDFIALDLETTGTDPQADQIIEVAAVRFQDGRPMETFHSLVNPHCHLSEIIQRLTGLSPAQLASAPPFDQVAKPLKTFLGAASLVGHNLAFDLGFLAAQGVKPPGQVYDTFLLGSLLFPQLPEYSLIALARHLGLELAAEHRALPHATASGNLLLALQARLSHLEPALGGEVARLASIASAPWWHLFKGFSAGPAPSVEKICPLAREADKGEPLVPRASPLPVDGEAIAHLLGPGGALDRSLSGFEHRPEQVHMARAVAESLSRGQHLIVEAGTGTGKSLAYLLPALTYALQNQAPIVLSTNTINLQEQLVSQDIPQLQATFGQFQGVRIATLKGRANYLCLGRWDAWRHSLVLSPEEALFLSRMLIWLRQTRSGDRAELHLLNHEGGLWNALAAVEANCTPEACPFQAQGHCFLYLARRRAESAHLVVTNHALLLSEAARGTRLLPESSHLIIDEAHHLEDEATEQLGLRLTSRQLGEHLDQLASQRRPETGLLSQVVAREATLPLARRRSLEALLEEGRRRLEQARSRYHRFFQDLGQFVASQQGNTSDYELRCRLTPAARAQPAWSALEIAGEDLALGLQGLGEAVGKLHPALEDLPGRMAGVASRLASFVATNAQLVEQLKACLFRPDKDYIYWLTTRGDEESLNSAPLRVGPSLEAGLYSRKKCTILTSATLSTQGNLSYARERLGLTSARELLLGSSFNYPASVLIYLLEGIPEPDRPGYSQSVEEAVAALARAAAGRTLALFTSHGALRSTLAAVRPNLEAEGIPVMGQGIDGTPRQLMAVFQSHPRALLLGTSSFWEGVDMPGEALRLLIIPRLPFPVPTDPIVEARCEAMEDGFNGYYLPQAILRLKQGFGRLIRRRTDRGVVAILDRRLQSRAYGRAFLASLPPATLKRGPLRHMVEEVKRWLSIPSEVKKAS